MKTNEKGYSLNVLVITIAVMIILTTTAILTMQSLTGDREITNFMNDVAEVETFVKEYYSRKKTLPILYEGNTPKEIYLSEPMQSQADVNDKGAYYEIDIAKLGKVNLSDAERHYFLNENTLKVYVITPVEYGGINYYTVTDELKGIDKTYGKIDTFEILVTGNPITWCTDSKLLVSVPDREDINENWTFKYFFGGPISTRDFEDMGTFFEYGESIRIDKNGIYSIYVENADGFAKVTNVVVSKIDNIDPYAKVDYDDTIIVSDDETGVSRIMYKIWNFDIPADERASNELANYYVLGNESQLPSDPNGGRWSYKEAYTGEKIEGLDATYGTSINRYKDRYQMYLADYEATEAASGDLTTLSTEYPEFQYTESDGTSVKRYTDNDRNIVLYVEDYAGNTYATYDDGAADNNLVSRNMLLENNFIDVIILPLSNVNTKINNDDKYTTSRNVEIVTRAQGAESMYITLDEADVPDADDWVPFESVVDYELPDTTGNITLYVYVTANQIENGILKYQKVNDSIFLDDEKPTSETPNVTIGVNDLKFNIESNQKDEQSGIEKTEFGYKRKDETKFTWVDIDDADEIELETGETYHVKTRAVDRAGNVQESGIVEILCPEQIYRSVANKPSMATGMTAIAWEGTLTRPGEEKEIDPVTGRTPEGEEMTWYNYQLGDGRTDSRESIWANAKTSDGSYWVWIPRYAYKIVYYEDSAKNIVKGYYQNSVSNGVAYFDKDGKVVTNPDEVRTKNVQIDIIFLKGTSNTEYTEENITTMNTSTKTLASEYIVHPAFQKMDQNAVNNQQGKWVSDLSGIWVAKFEASRSDAKIDDIGTTNKVKSVPSVKSWTNIKVSDAYDRALEMQPGLYSHLMKNSEWSAVAYLAYSAYGRNGNEISSNRASDALTGGGGTNGEYNPTESKFLSTYAYNARDNGDGKAGMYASSTGNIYGIFDMAGGVNEYVATYLNNANSNINQNGSKLTQTNSAYFREVYPVATTDYAINNYNKIKDVYGNAIYETSINATGQNSLESDSSYYPTGNNPFIIRGGDYSDGTSSGIFSFEHSTGAEDELNGFRPVMGWN